MAAGNNGMTPATAGNGTVRVDVHLHGAPPGTMGDGNGIGFGDRAAAAD